MSVSLSFKLIIANWKSYKNKTEIEIWLDSFNQWLSKASLNIKQKIVICPPMPAVALVAEKLQEFILKKQIFIGVQDVSPYPAGSYTGAVSVYNLSGFGISYAILGHSERRRYFYETNQQIANKINLCLESGITPLVCVDDDYIATQAAAIDQANLSKCIVVYEALAAIGTGESTPIDQVKNKFIQIQQVFGQVPMIYGGSVSPENAAKYLAIADGVLVATHSLTVDDFQKIIMSFKG